jgi:hypothetical protein
MPVAKRQNLFRLKLELCSVRYDFNDPATEADREIKRQTLLELIKFTNTPSGQKVFCDSSVPQVLTMLEANIFRDMPKEGRDGGGGEGEDDEAPAAQSEWPHLQAVYEFMLRFIVSSEIKPKIARKHLHRNFCKNIIALFDSEDPRERDYLKTILHRIYGKFMTYRSLIRRHIQYVFYEFLFETGRHNGIGELLEILGSIINGFQLPLKKEHLHFLSHTLIPLHKTKTIQFYHLQLSYCMTQYIEKDRNTAVPIVLGILQYWPWSTTSKQLLLFNELEDIMELISPAVLEQLVRVLAGVRAGVCVRACWSACCAACAGCLCRALVLGRCVHVCMCVFVCLYSSAHHVCACAFGVERVAAAAAAAVRARRARLLCVCCVCVVCLGRNGSTLGRALEAAASAHAWWLWRPLLPLTSVLVVVLRRGCHCSVRGHRPPQAVPLFKHIGKCIGSDHFQVQERCLFLWNNEHLVSNGCLSRQFCSSSLRHIYHNLNIVAQVCLGLGHSCGWVGACVGGWDGTAVRACACACVLVCVCARVCAEVCK